MMARSRCSNQRPNRLMRTVSPHLPQPSCDTRPVHRFFQSHPFPLGPDRNHQLIALLSPCGRALHAEAMRLERPLQIARMIVHPELALDQGRDALEGPALAGKARRHRAPVQEPAQTSPALLIEPRGPTRNRARFQTTRALLGEGGGPAADTGAADPKCPGDLGLRKPPLA